VVSQAALTAYLRAKMPAAKEVTVADFKRVSGGSSRETYSFELGWSESGRPQSRRLNSRRLILRRDPTGGLLQSSREREFKIIDAMNRAGLKVPEALFLELDPRVLERPFFVMGFAEGRVSPAPFSAEEQALLGERICDGFIAELARLQALNYRQMGLEWLGEPADLTEPAVEQTRHWREIYDRDRMGEHYPVLSAAFAWLAAHPVRADRITIVHGDFRAGNFLYDERGLLALLDWEMAHLGDPMEDLGWASMMFWGREDLAGGMLEREAFYRLYERKTGFAVDRERLFFYQVLGNAKMAVICLTGIRAFVEGKTSDAVMPFLEFLLSPLFDDLATQLKLT
jgi:aminoglycoside phosphotransferase (APT) family kinase protein